MTNKITIFVILFTSTTFTFFYILVSNKPGISDSFSQGLEGNTDTIVTPEVVATAAGNQEHQFGVVHIGETVRHQFKIVNTGTSLWKFAGITTSCTCTASKVSSPTIEPGATGVVELTYKAPAVALDDRKIVVVRFAQPEAPVISLTVVAKVRESLNVSKKVIEFLQVGRGKSVEEFVEVENFTKEDLTPPKVSSLSAWLDASLEPIRVKAGPDEPRQAWRMAVHVRTDGLEPGSHRGQITLEAVDTALHQVVDLSIGIMSPVAVIPPQMFFGSVAFGETARSKVLLRFAPDRVVSGRDAIRVKHDLGDRVKLELSRSSDRFWVLSASFTPTNIDALIEGRVEISFADDSLPTLIVPMRALSTRR